MSSLNRVMLIGSLNRDPETRTFQNGGKACNFSMATTERWKDKASGERKERTQFHNVVIFAEHLVRIAEQYLSKDSRVFVEGQMETRKWQDKSGNDRWTTEVVLRPYGGQIVLLGSKGGGNQQRREAPPPDDSEFPF